ncbi:MAG: alginate lyase family protein [Hyphomicrobiales bacterium]|nr:alginate lyase family protein [Hyphomicrobiales bacterium]MCA1998483.1 alginate lyase family protein [Hyphomicrobiales bacterium]
MIRALALALAFFVAGIGGARAATCPPPPPPVVDITSNTFYADSAGSIPDPALVEKRKASVAPLERFRADVARYASRGLAGNRDWSLCAGTWLRAWAEGGALLGRMSETQAHFERHWSLAGFAMAYLIARPALPQADRAVIEAWLDRVAEAAATAQYAARRKQANNLYYWLGFALGAASSATGNARHWGLAAETYRTALTHVEPDGSLPRETRRAGMALHYHSFALQPLVMLAELAARRGADWYALEGGAIHRLAAFTLAAHGDSRPLAERAGAAQKPLTRGQLAWLPFYARRFPERAAGAAAILAEGDLWSSMIGGNMSLIARRGIP